MDCPQDTIVPVSTPTSPLLFFFEWLCLLSTNMSFNWRTSLMNYSRWKQFYKKKLLHFIYLILYLCFFSLPHCCRVWKMFVGSFPEHGYSVEKFIILIKQHQVILPKWNVYMLLASDSLFCIIYLFNSSNSASFTRTLCSM